MTRRPDADVVVVGSGVAGLTTALGLAGHRRVVLVTSRRLMSGSTVWAQGGIAAALGPGDSPAQHAADTLRAAAGHADPVAVATLAREAPGRIAALAVLGVRFDRGATGRPLLAREGGHRYPRVVHAGGDATGAEVSRVLAAAVAGEAAAGRIDVVEDAEVVDLLVADGPGGRRVAGVAISRPAGGARIETARVTARAVVLATGGAGGLWPVTTNPAEVTGAGLGLALRAGASLADLEFVQFHPTVLATPGGAGHRRPLITEALRGAGAVLRRVDGAPVMEGVHPLGDLAPRDVVARRIDEVCREDGTGHVWLDATRVGAEALRTRFPTVSATCRAYGLDPATDPIPVAPAQHFLCGGIQVDDVGASDVPGLYAVGEVAATGVHGANRLASNSVLEGLVFGARLADRLTAALTPPPSGEAVPAGHPVSRGGGEPTVELVQALMGQAAGIRRCGADLASACTRLAGTPAGGCRDADLLLAARAVLLAAATRSESRGCHYRDDHPASEPRWRGRRVVVTFADGVLTARVGTPLVEAAG